MTHQTCNACAEIAAKLRAPFPENEVQWRRVDGVDMPYIDARTARDRLDEVLGPFGWQFHISVVPGRRALPKGKPEMDVERKNPGVQVGGIIGILQIRDPETNQWISRADGADQPDFESFKGGISDSFKRACVAFGVGAYLYEGAEAVRRLYVRLKAKQAAALRGTATEHAIPPKSPSPGPEATTPSNAKQLTLEDAARSKFAPSTVKAEANGHAVTTFKDMREEIIAAGDTVDAAAARESINQHQAAGWLTAAQANTLRALVQAGVATDVDGILQCIQSIVEQCANGAFDLNTRDKLLEFANKKARRFGCPVEVSL